MIFRLLKTGFQSAAFNMALDEAVLESVSSGLSLPTLRFYGWAPAAVSLGSMLRVDEEVDRQACAAARINLVRRQTGGGAVFHDRELTYSIVIPDSHTLYETEIVKSFEVLCQGLVEGLKGFGIDSAFAPINDILIGERKVSGNAQTRRLGCILQHGTVLLDVDLDLMFSILRVPPDKLKRKAIADARERVTWLSRVLGRTVTFDEAQDMFTAGFERGLGTSFENAEPTVGELESARRIARERYANEEYTNLR